MTKDKTDDHIFNPVRSASEEKFGKACSFMLSEASWKKQIEFRLNKR